MVDNMRLYDFVVVSQDKDNGIYSLLADEIAHQDIEDPIIRKKEEKRTA